MRGEWRSRLQLGCVECAPSTEQLERLLLGWRQELVTCRKFAPTARNYAAARLMADVGLRVHEARGLDLADIKWELGRFGKLHVRKGKGARGSGTARKRFERDRALGLVRVVAADVKFELIHHVPAELALGHHPLDRQLENSLGPALEQLPRRLVALAAGIA